MTRDLVVFAGLVLSFAAWVTAHVAIVFGLAQRAPRVRAAIALVVVPLAPYWAFAGGMRVRAAAWTAGLVAYAALRLFARG